MIDYENLKPWDNEEERFVAMLMSSCDINEFELTALEMRDLSIDFFNYFHNISQ